MPIVNVKFGGSTVNDKEKLEEACSTIEQFVQKGNKVVSINSAVRGVTDLLKDLTKRIDKNNFYNCYEKFEKSLKEIHGHSPIFAEELWDFEEKELKKFIDKGKPSWMKDEILVKGERWFSRNFAGELEKRGVETKFIDFFDPQFPTIVVGNFGNAKVNLEKTREQCQSIIPLFDKYDCLVIPGYGGIDPYHERIKTLRRGGSDVVFSTLGYGFSADAMWNITNVNGIKRVFTENIEDAPTVPLLTVNELRDASIYGAKVPNEEAVRPLKLHCPKETYIAKIGDMEGKKTRIAVEKQVDKKRPVEMVAGRDVVLYVFDGSNLREKIPKLELELYNNHIDYVDLGGGNYRRKLFVAPDQKTFADKIISAYKNKMSISVDEVAVVGIIGEGMKEARHVIEKMGRAVSVAGISAAYAVDMSEISTGLIIKREEMSKAQEVLYEEFALSYF